MTSVTLAAALAAACALSVAACGGDDDEPVASGTRDETTETTEQDPCDRLDEATVATVVGEVVDTGTVGGEPTFGAPVATDDVLVDLAELAIGEA